LDGKILLFDGRTLVFKHGNGYQWIMPYLVFVGFAFAMDDTGGYPLLSHDSPMNFEVFSLKPYTLWL